MPAQAPAPARACRPAADSSPIPGASPAAGTGTVPLPVAPTPVTLGDLGVVDFAPDPAAGVSRTNGEPSVGISVVKTSEANTVDVSDAVEEAMAASTRSSA